MNAGFTSSPPRKEACLSGVLPYGQCPDYFAAAHDLQALMFSVIADKLEENPALLDIPLGNIERWVSGGHPDALRLRAWQEMIERAQFSPDALAELVALLKDSSPDSVRWKGFSPFAGVLSPSELDALTDFS